MFSQFTKLFLLFALLLLIWNDSVSCFLSCRYKHFNYASNTSEIMPANACSSMFVHGGHLMNISGKYVNIMQSLSPVSAFFRNYSLYPFFILKAKNKLQANSAKIQDKSPKSTGIIWDLHQSVQEKNAHGRRSSHAGLKELRENPGVKLGVSWVPGPGMGLCLQHSPGGCSWWAKAAGCAHSILCLRKILQQKISLLNCTKTKPSINMKYFDARPASHSFSSLAIKWHQQWTQTL